MFLKSLPENPAYNCVGFGPENNKLFEESESKIPPLGIRILPHLEKYKLDLNLTDAAPSLDITPWKFSAPAVRLDLAKFKKKRKEKRKKKKKKKKRKKKKKKEKKQQTQKHKNSFICNLFQNIPHRRKKHKKTRMVLKQRQESPRQLSPQNIPGILWLVAFQSTAPDTPQNYDLFFWL